MNRVRLRPPRNRVERRAAAWWTAQSSVFALPLPITFAVLYLFIPPARGWFGPCLAVTLAASLAYMAVMPVWRYRVHRWETTAEAVYARSGWLWQRWRVVPISRIQTVDTLRGPLQTLFGLCAVTVTTASTAGAVKINGLNPRVATEIADHLTAHAQITAGAPQHGLDPADGGGVTAHARGTGGEPHGGVDPGDVASRLSATARSVGDPKGGPDSGAGTGRVGDLAVDVRSADGGSR